MSDRTLMLLSRAAKTARTTRTAAGIGRVCRVMVRVAVLAGVLAALSACAGAPAPENAPPLPAAGATNIPLMIIPPVTPYLLADASVDESVPDGNGVNRPAPIAPDLPPMPPPQMGTNPLTGLPIGEAGLPPRPLVVKISNAPPLVRPQAGIGAADWVFEHYAEGGLTRFSAVFFGNLPERVGSVRSARLIERHLVPMFGARLVYSGTSEGVAAVFADELPAARLFEGVRYQPPLFWRDEAVDPPHNMFANVRAIADLPDSETMANLYGLMFDPVAPAAGDPALSLSVRYAATVAQWDYDSAAGLYRRTTDGLPHADANTGEPITAANVIVLYAEHWETDIVESVWQDVISYSINMELRGTGDLLLLRDGVAVRGQWARPNTGGLIHLLNERGDPLPLKPGNTWVQVFPLPEQQGGAEAVTVGG